MPVYPACLPQQFMTFLDKASHPNYPSAVLSSPSRISLWWLSRRVIFLSALNTLEVTDCESTAGRPLLKGHMLRLSIPWWVQWALLCPSSLLLSFLLFFPSFSLLLVFYPPLILMKGRIQTQSFPAKLFPLSLEPEEIDLWQFSLKDDVTDHPLQVSTKHGLYQRY